jgi:hypothetical protein
MRSHFMWRHPNNVLIKKARKKWQMLILAREGARPKIMGILYKAVIQSVPVWLGNLGDHQAEIPTFEHVPRNGCTQDFPTHILL